VITFADITVAKTLEAKLRGDHASLAKGGADQSSKRAKVADRAPSDRPVGSSTKGNGKSRRAHKS